MPLTEDQAKGGVTVLPGRVVVRRDTHKHYVVISRVTWERDGNMWEGNPVISVDPETGVLWDHSYDEVTDINGMDVINYENEKE